jgi:lipoyl(octanoyl) transferase
MKLGSPEERVCQARWLGMVDYDTAWQMQAELAGQIARGEILPTFLLLEHPPTITIGRRGGREHILWSEDELARQGVAVREVDRGGDVTYHGPGQLVGYPLLPLAFPGWAGERLPQADFTGYLRKLEQGLIHLLARLGIAAGQREGLTGVWVAAEVWGKCVRCDPRLRPAPAKIASIGVKVDHNGISRHGFALNISPLMQHWESIIPCGLEGVQMACVADFVEPPDMKEIARLAAEELGEVLGYQMNWTEN